jgi:hypothetical protein
MVADDSDEHGDAGVLRRLDDIETALRVLSADLRALRGALRRELRTRRIVVVEDDGFERVVVSTRGGFGYVAVCGRDGVGGATCVELFANDPVDVDGAHVGMAVSDHGDVVAALDALEGHRPRLWIDTDR